MHSSACHYKVSSPKTTLLKRPTECQQQGCVGEICKMEGETCPKNGICPPLYNQVRHKCVNLTRQCWNLICQRNCFNK